MRFPKRLQRAHDQLQRLNEAGAGIRLIAEYEIE